MKFNITSYLIGKATSGGGGGGSEYVLSGTETPTAQIGENGDIYLQYKNINVPAEYVRLDSISSSGTQFIDSGIKATSNITVEIDFSDFTISGDKFLFGFRPGNWEGLGINNNGHLWCYYGNNGSATGYTVTSLTSGVVKLENGKVTVNKNVVATFTPTSFSYNANLFIFGVNNSGNMAYGASFALHECAMWNDGILVRDFVPVKRKSDDVLGLYDFVEGIFYTNSGSGDFVSTGNAIQAVQMVRSTKAKVNGSWRDLIGTDIRSLHLWENDNG